MIFFYSHNAPYYLNYFINFEDDKLYKENVKSFKKRTIILNKGNVSINEEELYPKLDYDFDLNINEYEYILISSDGLSSFKDKNGVSIPLENIVKEICNFKNLKGEFLKRRMNRQMNIFNKNGFFHYDDISIAGIVF